MSLSLDIVVLGALQGLMYGALAIGLVLVYRAQRFVNFAQTNLGLISAVLLAKLTVDLGLPYLLALPLALAAGAGLAVLIELTVIRRLFDSPRLALMVGTIFLSQLLLVPKLIPAINADKTDLVLNGYPMPFRAQVTIGELVLGPEDLMVLIVVPTLVAGLALFMRFTTYGRAIRASADNPDAARLAGISVRRMSTVVWLLAGLLSAAIAILAAPQLPIQLKAAAGAGTLVRALGAALLGRMVSMPVSFAAGIGIGVLEAVVFANTYSGGATELAVFLVVMAALLLRARELSKATRDSTAGLNFGAEPAPLAPAIARLPKVRRLTWITAILAVGLGIALPLLPVLDLNTQGKAFLLTILTCYCLVGLSLCVLTGWGGQVSLGQFAFVGVGAFGAARITQLLDLPVWAVLPMSAVLGTLIAILVGLPAVRIQGLFLAVSTVAFSVLASGYLFQAEWLVGSPEGMYMPRPSYLDDERRLYYVGLALVVLTALVVRNFRRTAAGRMLIAVRDNDMAARANGVSAAGTRIFAFALSGFICSIAGVLYAMSYQRFSATTFSPDLSFALMTMVVVGGLGTISGALLGPVFVYGVPLLARGSEMGQMASLLMSGVGGLVVLLFLPRGLAGIAFDLRDVIVRRITGEERQRTRPRPSEVWRMARGKADPHQDELSVVGAEDDTMILERTSR